MKAMVLENVGHPLMMRESPVPDPGPNEILLRVQACAVCRTDLHLVDGELPNPKLPIVPGHEIVGTVVSQGPGTRMFKNGDRVGVPWMGSTCGRCVYCDQGLENLCDNAGFTGYTIDGGYAEYTVAREQFCIPIPEGYSAIEAAPLLCAGLIGYRSLVKAGPAKRIGIYGFGAAAHIVTQIARYQGRDVYAFTRPGDEISQEFAYSLGVRWAGGSDQPSPVELDAALIFAPVGELIPLALASTRKGGIVVCGGIHMSDIPSFPYTILWGERQLVSVANLTRQDGEEFMRIAPKVPVKTHLRLFSLSEANLALRELRSGNIEGAAVLTMERN